MEHYVIYLMMVHKTLILHFCGLIHGAISTETTQYTVLNDRMSDELEEIWKEAVMA
jgi:hypothetical protein